jgi:hypothetical protein
MDYLMSRLPAADKIAGAICRLRLEYAYEHDALLDERPIHEHFAAAFDLRIIKHRVAAGRAKLGNLVAVEMLSPYDLLTFYWRTKSRPEAEIDELLVLAADVLNIHAPTAGGHVSEVEDAGER